MVYYILTDACVPCDPGTFANESMVAEKHFGLLQKNMIGSIISSLGDPNCSNCPLGQCTSKPLCTPCYPGSFNAEEGQSSCHECQPGNYADKSVREIVYNYAVQFISV